MANLNCSDLLCQWRMKCFLYEKDFSLDKNSVGIPSITKFELEEEDANGYDRLKLYGIEPNQNFIYDFHRDMRCAFDRILYDFLNDFNIKYFYKEFFLWKFNTVGEIGYNYDTKSLDFLIKIDIGRKSIFKEIKEKKQQIKREKLLKKYVNYYL